MVHSLRRQDREIFPTIVDQRNCMFPEGREWHCNQIDQLGQRARHSLLKASFLVQVLCTGTTKENVQARWRRLNTLNEGWRRVPPMRVPTRVLARPCASQKTCVCALRPAEAIFYFNGVVCVRRLPTKNPPNFVISFNVWHAFRNTVYCTRNKINIEDMINRHLLSHQAQNNHLNACPTYSEPIKVSMKRKK